MPDPLKSASAVAPSRVVDSVRYAPNPLPELTPANLATYLDSFRRGYLRDTAILWDAMLQRDDRLASVSPKRCKSISRYGYRVTLADGVDAKSPAAVRHVAAIQFALENLTAHDACDTSVTGGVAMLVRQMMAAVGFRYQVHELVWRKMPGGLTLDATALPLWWFERTTGALRYLTADLAIEGVPLEPAGWMITRGDGLMAATSVCYLLKRMALTDWAVYNGRVGPGIHGKTPAQPGSDQWNALEDAVENFGMDLKMVTGDGVTITPIEVALRGTLPWPAMYDAMDKAISVIWRGGNLSTDSAGGPDQSGVTLQGAERDLLEQDDASMVSDAINDFIVAPLIRARFGEQPLAWVEWGTGARPDVKQTIEVDRFLVDAGFPLTVEDLAQRYDRPVPAPGQQTLVPRAAAVPAANSALPFQVSGFRSQVSPPVSLPAVDATLAAREDAFAPWLARLNALSAQTFDTEPAFLDAVETLIRQIPAELATRANIARLAQILDGAMGNAVLSELETATSAQP